MANYDYNHIAAVVDSEFYAVIKAACEDEGLTVSKLIRDALIVHLNNLGYTLQS